MTAVEAAGPERDGGVHDRSLPRNEEEEEKKAAIADTLDFC